MAKSGISEIKSNETNLDGKSTSISQRNDDQVANDNRNPINHNQATNLSDIKSGILITSYSTVSTI